MRTAVPAPAREPTPERVADNLPYVDGMGAAVDCEAIRQGLLGQTANALSSLVFVLAGVWMLRRAPTRWVGLALIATGTGSFLFHGPTAPDGEWIHDVTLAWLLAVVMVETRQWAAGVHLACAGVVAIGFALVPVVANVTMAMAAIATVVLLLVDDRSRRTWLPLVLLGAAALVGRLGATGGPLCDATSIVQPHALWHVGSAVAVTWWAEARSSAMSASHQDTDCPGCAAASQTGHGSRVSGRGALCL